jgi:hypothetical protein
MIGTTRLKSCCCFMVKQRFSRWIVILLAVLIMLGLGHAFILRLVAWPLTAKGALSWQAGFYALHGDEYGADGFEAFDSAAAWYAEAPGRKILLFLPPDSHLVEIGAVRSFERTCRSELDKRRIPMSDVLSVHVASRGAAAEARVAANWLAEHREATVMLACSAFRSNWLRQVFDNVLGPADAGRIEFVMLADPKCRPENWWKSRAGVKEFMYGWLELIYGWSGGDKDCRHPTGAAEFQQEMRTKIGEAPQ